MSGLWVGDEAALAATCADVMGPDDSVGPAVETLVSEGYVTPHYTQLGEQPSSRLSGLMITPVGKKALRF